MEENVEQQLRAVVETVDAANALTAPLLRSIENLLKLAGAAVGSDEVSVIVSDGTSDNLIFLAAVGRVADKLRGMKIPLGRGIAGFVFSSGQPIAVADVGQDSNFYAEVDRQTGYSTHTILATPLRFDGEIIGVLEFVNRVGETPFAAFTPDEMDEAALYADAIATLVDAHESAALIENLCGRLGEQTDLRNWLKTVRSTPEHREMIELALLVRDIAASGEPQRRLCREILEAVARFSQPKQTASYLNF